MVTWRGRTINKITYSVGPFYFLHKSIPYIDSKHICRSTINYDIIRQLSSIQLFNLDIQYNTPGVKSMKYRTVFRKALEENNKQAYCINRLLNNFTV